MLYLRGESNPYLEFRKLLFYPLNYRGIDDERTPPGHAPPGLTAIMQLQNYAKHFNLANFLQFPPCFPAVPTVSREKRLPGEGAFLAFNDGNAVGTAFAIVRVRSSGRLRQELCRWRWSRIS